MMRKFSELKPPHMWKQKSLDLRAIRKAAQSFGKNSLASPRDLDRSSTRIAANKLPHSVGDVLSEKILNAADPGHPRFKGLLWRHILGFLNHFVPKYCLVSKLAFYYYKTEEEANAKSDRPLTIIPLDQIISIDGAVNESPMKPSTFVTSMQDKERVPKFKFTMRLREGWKEFGRVEDRGEHVVLKNEAEELVVSKFALLDQDKHLMRSPMQKKATLQVDPGKRRKKSNEWSKRETDWYLAEEQFTFCSHDRIQIQKWILLLKYLIHQA